MTPELTAEIIAQKFEINLYVTFDSRNEMGCEDEEFGHYIQCEWDLGFKSVCPPVIIIYENGLIQFFHDATPYPVAANSTAERQMMRLDMCPCPVHYENVSFDDYKNFIGKMQSIAQEYEDIDADTKI